MWATFGKQNWCCGMNRRDPHNIYHDYSAQLAEKKVIWHISPNTGLYFLLEGIFGPK